MVIHGVFHRQQGSSSGQVEGIHKTANGGVCGGCIYCGGDVVHVSDVAWQVENKELPCLRTKNW